MNWHKMRAPNFEARTGLEIAEFARMISEHALYLVDRIQPDELVLALDSSPNWRSEVYSRYYRHHVAYYRYLAASDTPPAWVVQFDKKTFLARLDTGMDKWVYTKLAKKDTEAYNLDNRLEWEPWLPSLPTEWAEGQEPPLVVTDSPDWPNISPMIPKYKGNRATSRWDYETTKEEFRSLGANLGKNIAPLLGGVAVQVALAEGDDIVAAFVGMHTEGIDDTVLVSIDSDLHQLVIDCPSLRIFDPGSHSWVERTPERAAYDLTHKILTGDTADNICGVALRGATSTLGPKSAEKLIEDNGGVDGVWSFLLGEEDADWKVLRESGADRAALDRNMELVALNRIPAALRQEIEDQLQAARETIQAKKTAGWELDGLTLRDFGLTSPDLIRIRACARADRERDLAPVDPMGTAGGVS